MLLGGGGMQYLNTSAWDSKQDTGCSYGLTSNVNFAKLVQKQLASWLTEVSKKEAIKL